MIWKTSNDGRIRPSHLVEPVFVVPSPDIPDVRTWEEVNEQLDNPDPLIQMIMASRISRRDSHHDINPNGTFRCATLPLESE